MIELKYFSPYVLFKDSVAIYQQAGLSAEDARIISQALIDAEITGVASHGLLRTEHYVRCIRSGGIQPEGRFAYRYDSPSWAALDGLGGLGIIISHRAMLLAIEKARATGIGLVNVNHSHHFGAAGQYALLAARQNMIGLAMSNTGPMMTITGTNTRRVGNNPFSYCAPAGKYDYLMLDMAMSRYSNGKLQVYRDKGEPMPPGCALDKNGNPTTNPDDYFNGGILLPFGDYKAYGLAVMVDVFAGLLSGAGVLGEVNAWNSKPGVDGNTGHCFMALDIQRLVPVDEFTARMEAMIEYFKSAPLAPGASQIYYPGEPEQEAERLSRQQGIGLPPATVDSLIRAAGEVGCVLHFLEP